MIRNLTGIVRPFEDYCLIFPQLVFCRKGFCIPWTTRQTAAIDNEANSSNVIASDEKFKLRQKYYERDMKNRLPKFSKL
jgi:hypothetical protein